MEEDERMPASWPERARTWGARSGAALLGAGLLAGWLVAWRLTSDAAAWFAPALALFGLIGALLARLAARRGRPLPALALRATAWGAAGLSFSAAWGVGAFLPPGLATWLSPPLARFGGAMALGLLALGAALGLVVASAKPPGALLDALLGCALGAVWVGHETARQRAFPPPPTSAVLLAPRFNTLLALAVGFALLAVVSAWAGSRSAETSRRAAWALPADRLWRWATLLTVLGLLGGAAIGSGAVWRFALLALLLLALRVRWGWTAWRRRGWSLWRVPLRVAGWLLLLTALATVGYFLTSEDLQTVLFRDTVTWRVLQGWRAVVGDERFVARPVGALTGTVRDERGRPLPGAAVVVAGPDARPYSGRSDATGYYRITAVPAGNYLPLAVASGYRQNVPVSPWSRVATVRAGRETAGVDFRLVPAPPLAASITGSLQFGPPATASAENPEPSVALRRAFTFTNRGAVLSGGLVYEPPADLGPGPFPILVIVYPGEAKYWEGVSVPLAARGYVVVSYFPQRLLDLAGDLDDLRLLLSFAAVGRFSARGDPERLVLIGGSVSTVYTYRLARELAGSPLRSRVRALIQYGGLFDFFAYRHAWERGQVTIDPGISGLEYLLIAFGRPQDRPELYLRFSPRYALGSTTLPPTLLVHAGQDNIVPVAQSELADAELRRLGVPHRLLLYPTLAHYLDTSKRDPAELDMLEQTLAFLRDYVGR